MCYFLWRVARWFIFTVILSWILINPAFLLTIANNKPTAAKLMLNTGFTFQKISKHPTEFSHSVERPTL